MSCTKNYQQVNVKYYIQMHQIDIIILMASSAGGVLQEVEAARSFLANVHAAYPEVAQAVRTSQLAHVILAHKNQFVEHLTYTGTLATLINAPFSLK